jgi:tetratricopeptide (TPR) repeat protein
VEIDLTQLLGELQGQSPPPEAPPRAPRDLDQVFAEMRSEVAGADDDGVSGDHVELARTYLDMGMPQEAIGCLQIAARSPQYRFVAASMIGEIHRDEGDLRAAIEWFERAAEVPPPEPERGRVLLYDLADLLETVGEPARSLAVFLELTADAPGYRDVHDRVARLSRIETEG